MSATGNVIPLRAPALTLAPGVPAFDPRNPAHVKAWNSLFALGKAEQRRMEAGR